MKRSISRAPAATSLGAALSADRWDRFCGHHRPGPHHQPTPPRRRRSRPHGQRLRYGQYLRCVHPKAPQDALVARDRVFHHCRRSVFRGRSVVPHAGRCPGVEISPVGRGEGESRDGVGPRDSQYWWRVVVRGHRGYIPGLPIISQQQQQHHFYYNSKIHIHIGNPEMYPGCPPATTGVARTKSNVMESEGSTSGRGWSSASSCDQSALRLLEGCGT